MEQAELGSAKVYFDDGDPSQSCADSLAGRMVRARKRVVEVGVRFATTACEVPTLEGLVSAHAGDAIVTGVKGECWPVRPADFLLRYEPVPPIVFGANGAYRTKPIHVRGVCMDRPFAVERSSAGMRLQGRAGDWLVDYGSEDYAVVDPSVFAVTYELMQED